VIPSSDLHQLIHSLSGSELRYIKGSKQKKEEGSNTNYLVLLDAILEQMTYDEVKLKHKLKQHKFVNHLASEKKYLYEHILKSLRQYHSDVTPENSLNDYLAEIHILKNKQLFDQGLKLIGKAKILALEFECYDALIELNKEAIEIYLYHSDTLNWVEIDNLTTEMNKFHQKNTLLLEIFCHSKDYTRIIRNSLSIEKNNFELSLILISNVLGASDSFRIKTSYLALNLMIKLKDLKNPNIKLEFSEIKSIWDEHPKFKKYYPLPYIRFVRNYLTYLHQVEDFENFGIYLNEIKALSETNANTYENFYRYSTLEILYYLNTNQLEKICDNAELYQSQLTSFTNKLSKSKYITFSYNVVIGLFLNQKWRACLDWINRITAIKKTDERVDIQRIAHVLLLFIHFELGNDDILYSLCRATKRKEGKLIEYTELDKLAINMMNKLQDANDQVARLKIQSKFYDDVCKYKAKMGDTHEIGMNEMYVWAHAKHHQIPLQEAWAIALIKSKK